MQIFRGSSAGGGGGGTTYTNLNPTLIAVGGIGVGATFDHRTMQQMFDSLLHPHVSPSVSLAITPSSGLIEFGDPVPAPTLTPTTTVGSIPITTLTISRSGVGLIHTYSSPLPGGGTESPYTDTSGPVTSNTTYTATVGDGTGTGTATRTYSFVYPYYYGVGAPGLTGAQIGALTKIIQTQQNTNTTTSPTSQVYYFAYLSSYPVLTSILDQSGFETIGDYIVRIVPIVGLDGTSQNYRVYEFNHLTTQIGFTNHYIY